MNPDIAHLRKSHERAQLLEAEAGPDPLALFARWFAQAREAGVPEPNAMTLATVGSDLRPSTRLVLIKDYGPDGIVFYTNYRSRKGRELAGNPWAALQFHWVEQEQMVRIEGRVHVLDAALSDAYYASRPLGSRLGAWASPQSQVIASPEALQQAFRQAEAEQGDAPTRPPHWGGYRLVPDRWEFWQGRPSRLHDRLRYRLQHDGSWLRERLAP